MTNKQTLRAKALELAILMAERQDKDDFPNEEYRVGWYAPLVRAIEKFVREADPDQT
jgi:hypothetical protein